MDFTLYPVTAFMTGTTANGGGLWKYVLHKNPHGLLRRNLPVLSQVLHFLDFNIPPQSLARWRAKTLREHYNGNLGLDYRGELFLDSGGYTLMFDPDLDLGAFGISKHALVKEVLGLQLQLGGNFVTALDYPIPPDLSSQEADERQTRTLRSAQLSAALMAETGSSAKLYVPVHGLHPEHLAHFIGRLRETLEADGLWDQVHGLALGSMVPRRKGGRFDEVLEFVKAARRAMPEGMPLHVFGVTGVMVPYLMAEGASSFDASRYVQEARTLTYLNPDNGRKISWRHLSHYPCGCPVCRNRDIDEDRRIMDGRLEGRQKSEVYAAIALHNLELDLGIWKDAVAAYKSGELKEYVAGLPLRFSTLRLPNADRERVKALVNSGAIRQHRREDYDLRTRQWKPDPVREVLLLLPCSQEKPYTRSASFKKVWKHLGEAMGQDRDRLEVIFLSGLYGPVPLAQVEEEAVMTYDFILHGRDADGISAISKRLADFLEKHGQRYRGVVFYVSQPAYRRAIELARPKDTPVSLLPKGRLGRLAFYKRENLEALARALKECLDA